MISRFLACYSQLCSLSICTIYPMFFAWCSVRCSHSSHVFLMFCYNNRFILFGLPQSFIMLASTRGKWKFFTIGVPFWFWQGLYWHIRISHNSHVFPMFCYNNRFILFGLHQSSIMLASTREKWKLFTIGVPFWFWQGLYWHIGCNLDIWYWYGCWYWRIWQFCMSWGNMNLISIPVCFGTWGNTRYIPVLYHTKSRHTCHIPGKSQAYT
jgi:hypothetical protein